MQLDSISSSNEILNTYFDNGIYKMITKPENEHIYNNFFDSLIKVKPEFNNGLYKPFNSIFSFLEAIGLGGKQEESGGVFEKMPPISQDELDAFLDMSVYEYMQLFDRRVLCEKINSYIPYATNKATKGLSTECFEKYKQMFISDSDAFILKLAYWLALDKLNWRFPYANISSKDRDLVFEMGKDLLAIHFKSTTIIPDLPFHRLSTSIFESFLYLPEFEQKNPNIMQDFKKNAVKNRKDLCDIETIDFAVFGVRIEDDFRPCIIFTTDDRIVIETRLKIQNTVIQYVERELGQEIRTRRGTIYIVDKTSGIISENNIIYVDEYRNSYNLPTSLIK